MAGRPEGGTSRQRFVAHPSNLYPPARIG
ncbi:hypothetical protein MPLB_1560001 [Mesorhizobium sp. ORS 3324]|nr:hypothetical protein MPLB_1560001 [Mesorhizobium sp. ORS 3324]